MASLIGSIKASLSSSSSVLDAEIVSMYSELVKTCKMLNCDDDNDGCGGADDASRSVREDAVEGIRKSLLLQTNPMLLSSLKNLDSREELFRKCKQVYEVCEERREVKKIYCKVRCLSFTLEYATVPMTQAAPSFSVLQ